MLSDRPLMVLCDLEGVLLDIPGESVRHRAALNEALRTVTGLQADVPEQRDGHTDYTLLCAALAALGMRELLNEQAFDLIAIETARLYKETCPNDLSWFLRPGVWAALMQFSGDTGLKIVPCSGMFPGIARLLIERADISGPLSVGFGSFAAYGRTRPDLVQAARERAGGYAGLPWPQNKTVVVSRSSEDLVAAKSAGVRTIAIACQDAPADVCVEQFELVPSVLAHWR